MSKLHRDGETEQVIAFLRHGCPKLAFAVIAVRRLTWAGVAIAVAFFAGQTDAAKHVPTILHQSGLG